MRIMRRRRKEMTLWGTRDPHPRFPLSLNVRHPPDHQRPRKIKGNQHAVILLSNKSCNTHVYVLMRNLSNSKK